MSEQTPRSIVRELATHAASAFEAMTGERPQISVRDLAGRPEETAVMRRQTFSGVTGAMWIGASEADSSAAGGLVLEAAGLEETDPEKRKKEFFEIVNQAISATAQAVSGWLGREVRPDQAEENPAPANDVTWAALDIRQGQVQATLVAGVEPALASALAPSAPVQAIAAPVEKPPTFDLLLDVELPISVSFGHAQVPLKDVLKLTTGSIVELNRAIGDPVEVIVNNCVIARGEVVSVEGNFGVRIQEVISRQERWKTVH